MESAGEHCPQPQTTKRPHARISACREGHNPRCLHPGTVTARRFRVGHRAVSTTSDSDASVCLASFTSCRRRRGDDAPYPQLVRDTMSSLTTRSWVPSHPPTPGRPPKTGIPQSAGRRERNGVGRRLVNLCASFTMADTVSEATMLTTPTSTHLVANVSAL